MHCPRDSFESIDLDLGDCIGVESCFDLKNDVDVDSCSGVQKSQSDDGGSSGSDQPLEKNAARGFPPPLPWLGSTECTPWIMNRYYTNDGRLIIRGEKIKRHEYFHADRSNGRFILRLVPFNDDELDKGDGHDGNNNNKDGFIESSVGNVELDDNDDDDDYGGNDKNGFLDDRVGSDDRNDGYDGEREDQLALEEETRILDHAAGLYNKENGGAAVIGGFGGGGGREKFYQNCSMTGSCCLFGEIVVATVRSVHT